MERYKFKLIKKILKEANHNLDKVSEVFDHWANKITINTINKRYGADNNLTDEQLQKIYNHIYTLLMNRKKKFIELFLFLDNKDIFTMKDISDLDNELENAQRKKNDKEFYKMSSNDFTTIYKDEQIKIIVPLTHKGACYYGRGTKWCTSARSTIQHFNDYTRFGILYHILYLGIDKKILLYYSRKWGTKEYYNEQDFKINPPELPEKAQQAIEDYYNQHKKV